MVYVFRISHNQKSFIGKKVRILWIRKKNRAYFGQFWHAVPVHNPVLEIINIFIKNSKFTCCLVEGEGD